MTCPYCRGDLGDLNEVMDGLKSHGYGSEIEFSSQCCQGKIKAYNRVGYYYIIAVDSLPEGRVNKPLLIGGG